MIKKIHKKFIINILIIFCINLLFPINCYAKGENRKPPYIEARCAIAMDANTGVVLYEKNAQEIVPMASTTKIMTSLVAIKYGDLDKKIKISKQSASVRGSTVGYKKGEEVTLRELLYGLMLRSGNDAAIAIAQGVAGSVEKFCKLMNEYASEIGILNSHFQTPHGLDKDEHYSTAYDLALVTREAKKNKIFNEIVGCKEIKKQKYNFTRDYNNINKILWRIPEATGVKTGYTGKAGKCLVSSAKINDSEVIMVVLNCTPRWRETDKIFKYVKQNYDFKNVYKKGDIIDEAVYDEGSIKLVADQDITVPFKNGCEYSTKIIKPKQVKWKVKKGDKFGTLCVFDKENLIFKKQLRAGNSFKNKSIKKWFFN